MSRGCSSYLLPPPDWRELADCFLDGQARKEGKDQVGGWLRFCGRRLRLRLSLKEPSCRREELCV